MKWLSLGFLAFVACASPAPGVVPQSTPDGLGALIRQLVGDALQAGGAHGETIVVAADSTSATLLRLADVPALPVPGPKPLLCPGSTEADGRRAASPVGYVVQVALASGADTATRQLRVTKSCSVRYRGSILPFAESAAWEVRRQGGRWRVTAALYHLIT